MYKKITDWRTQLEYFVVTVSYHVCLNLVILTSLDIEYFKYP